MEYDPGQDAYMVHLYIVSGEEDILAAYSLCIEEIYPQDNYYYCQLSR
jgi:hypothetical protein